MAKRDGLLGYAQGSSGEGRCGAAGSKNRRPFLPVRMPGGRRTGRKHGQRRPGERPPLEQPHAGKRPRRCRGSGGLSGPRQMAKTAQASSGPLMQSPPARVRFCRRPGEPVGLIPVRLGHAARGLGPDCRTAAYCRILHRRRPWFLVSSRNNQPQRPSWPGRCLSRAKSAKAASESAESATGQIIWSSECSGPGPGKGSGCGVSRPCRWRGRLRRRRSRQLVVAAGPRILRRRTGECPPADRALR
jgi:hypothetical protein